VVIGRKCDKKKVYLMKKFIGTLLAIALVLSLMPLNVFSNTNNTAVYPNIEADFQIL
jgi:hypothetical protein